MFDIPHDELVFVSLGGIGEIGMNFYVYGYKGKWLIVDVGIGFADSTEPGVDIIMADPSFMRERKKDIVGIVVTHGHEDHVGAVAHLWHSFGCPVYTTPFTAKLLATKLDEAGLLGVTPVDIVKQGERVLIEPFDVEFIAVTHSTPEACALAIRTDAGTVLHTGDWKFEPNPVIGKPTDFDALERLGEEGVLAMIGDSTNVLSEKREGTEADVRESLIKLFSEYNGKIATACFASNVARLESIALAAKANGRCVSLVGRSLWRIEGAARAVGYLKGIDDFIEADEARQLPDDKVLYICTGSQGEPRAALSRIAKNTHRFLKLGEGDVVIFSSRVIPGNEKSIFELQNNLYSLGAEIVTEKDRFIHVSGHPSREELVQLYKIIRPKISIPAHGEARHLIEHCQLAESLGVEKTEVIENGQMVCLSDDVCNHVDIIGEVKTGRLAIDGKNIVAYDSPALRARRKIIYNCSAVITIVIDSKCRIVGEPQLSVPGLLDSGTQKEEIKAIIKEVRQSLKGMHKNKIKNDDSVSNVVRQAVRRSINNTFGKKPITDVHLVRI